MKFRDISIKIRLFFSFGLLFLLFAGFAYFQHVELNNLARLSEQCSQLAGDMERLMRIDSRVESLNSLAARALLDQSSTAIRKGITELAALSGDDIDFVKKTGSEVGLDARAAEGATAYAAFAKALTGRLLPLLEQGTADPDRITAVSAEVASEFGKTMPVLDELQDALHAKITDGTKTSAAYRMELERTSILLAIGMMGLTLLLATLLGLSIARPICNAVAFARKIAEGDFSARLDVNRRDEVGRLCAAMDEIPKVLTDMGDRLTGMVEKVEMGELRTRASAEGLQGEYRVLLERGNRVAEALTGYIDAIPTPVMAMNNDMDILFLNKAGREVGGHADDRSYLGTKCYDTFRTSDCNTPNCACTRAMRSRALEQAETDAHPQAMDLEIKYIGSPIIDSHGKVAGAFEIVIDQTEVVGMQRKVGKLAEHASSISETLASAAMSLSSQVGQASRGAHTQSERTAETATAMEEMNATVLEVARNATSAAENTDQATIKAREGAEVVGRVVDAIRKVQDHAAALKNDMTALGKRAEGIGTIIEVITDIADQTNLLALNAAIEAARAGEAGRGFAVVADEVRKLAEKTMTATTEVNQAIRGIQTSSMENVAATEKAAKAVEESTGLADQARAVLEEIVAFSGDSAGQVQSIAAASEQQSATADQITRSTEEIDTISQETSRSMQQAASSVSELQAMAGELDDLIRQMIEK
ncbi:methyl-accepting chemotaxis protein [Pseudodesulfovibrio sp.]|uniref:methyl-accepting chemotaxis protein n=1 Tax=Pseudodesulfovibrio sp. TaxID=2035812 RepID=UPI00261413B2|nr:methyl-accepting chemotaxis protein [Pseudodesulfovibrio sp.]MDD3313764.1 methyl-accepting chemotaxis protein [Pseudodesulfovibrio sp.]